MSNATSYSTLDFPAETAGGWKRPKLLSTVRLVMEAISEGQAASQRYQELIRRGMAPDRAVDCVFGEIYAAH